jgi:hypothetical protein
MMTNTPQWRWVYGSCRRLSCLVLVAALMVVVLVVIRVVSQRAGDSRQHDIEKAEQTQRQAISRLVRSYYEMSMGGSPDPYEELLKQHPELVSQNPTNQGAEMMYLIFSLPYSSVSSAVDTDSDGRPEACDAWGDPLIFLTPDRKSDTIVRAGGHTGAVLAPPFFEKGFYINSLRFHAWFGSDQRALESAAAADTRPSR